jgi:hypothetical protein
MANFTKISSFFYIGLSTDDKPTGVELLAKCYETNTNKTYMTRDGTNWIEVSNNVLGGIPFLPDYAMQTDLAVPAQNTVDNVDIADVIGNKTDTVAGNSIISLLKAIKAKTDTL